MSAIRLPPGNLAKSDKTVAVAGWSQMPILMGKNRTMDNKQRARQVNDALLAFARETGLDPSHDGDGPQTVAGDFICGVLHWVEQNLEGGRKAALVAARHGIGHYLSESHIDYGSPDHDELGPEAHVAIEASCNGEDIETWTGEAIANRIDYSAEPDA